MFTIMTAFASRHCWFLHISLGRCAAVSVKPQPKPSARNASKSDELAAGRFKVVTWTHNIFRVYAMMIAQHACLCVCTCSARARAPKT